MSATSTTNGNFTPVTPVKLGLPAVVLVEWRLSCVVSEHSERMSRDIVNGLPLPLRSVRRETGSLIASESAPLLVSAVMQQLRDTRGPLRGTPHLCPAPQAKRNEPWLRLSSKSHGFDKH